MYALFTHDFLARREIATGFSWNALGYSAEPLSRSADARLWLLSGKEMITSRTTCTKKNWHAQFLSPMSVKNVLSMLTAQTRLSMLRRTTEETTRYRSRRFRAHAPLRVRARWEAPRLSFADGSVSLRVYRSLLCRCWLAPVPPQPWPANPHSQRPGTEKKCLKSTQARYACRFLRPQGYKCRRQELEWLFVFS